MTKWLANCCIAIVSTLLALGLGEVYLRVEGFSYPSLYKMDEVTGHKLRPGAEGWFREEGEAYVRINHDGWRDQEHARMKSQGTKRIAILGDSYAEALQVSEDKAFWSVLERELNACSAFGNMRAEVMNFGVSGYGTAQELLAYQHRVSQYSPDIVVLAFTAGNDVRDNSKTLSNAVARPYFVYDEGSLVLDNSFTESRNYLIKKSGIWVAVQEASDSLKMFQLFNHVLNRLNQIQQRSFQQSEGPSGLEPGLDDNVYRESYGGEWEEAWRVTENLILKLRDAVTDQGAKLLVVSLSSGIQVHPSRATREQFTGKLRVKDLFYPERRLQKLGADEGFEVITLAPYLMSFAEKHQVFLHGFKNQTLGRGHWNIQGHMAAGEGIARHFCRYS